MRIALAGAGAFGEKPPPGLTTIDGGDIGSLTTRRADQAP
jgi:hypothetical protein